MPEIADWIKKIIAILVLAGFLEMILPNNEFKGVAKMMIGLLIILIIVQPVLQIFKLPTTILNSIPAAVEADYTKKNSLSTNQIIKEGLAVRAGWIGKIEKHNQEILIDKIKLSVGLIDGVQLLDTNVEWNDPDPTGFTGLKKVYLRVKWAGPQTKGHFSPASFQREEPLVGRRIRDTIKLFSNLSDEQIEVIWDGGQ
jgi:stage III sporulation protein AF